MFSIFRGESCSYNPVSSRNIEDDGTSCATFNDGTLSHPHSDSHLSSPPTFTSLLFYPVLFCGVSAIISIFLLHISPSHSSTSNLSLYELQSGRKDLTNLRRPSQFMGLDKINQTSHDISVINFPFIVGKIDEQNPYVVITHGPESHFVANGLEARRVQITERISTVVQFRTIDWRLEACALRLRLPGSANARAVDSNTNNRFEVHRISSGSVLDLDSLSFHSLPPVKEKLATLLVDSTDGLEWTHHFECVMDSLHTFVLVAGDRQTDVGWWQNKRVEVPSIHIVQRDM
ncbi:hypothetical protein B0H10DRAFT_286904 [Mycena sp. CBHHK59/15]|nr:hypothetical protein B0H10DRAFT_286904 [Mycena sp. CBHHK59/15]